MREEVGLIRYINISEAINKFYSRLNDGDSDNRKTAHTVNETVWQNSCISCKNFYNEVCHEHCFRIDYGEARTKTCPKQLFHASEFYDLED